MFSALKEKAEFYFLDTESSVVYAATAEKPSLFKASRAASVEVARPHDQNANSQSLWFTSCKTRMQKLSFPFMHTDFSSFLFPFQPTEIKRESLAH